MIAYFIGGPWDGQRKEIPGPDLHRDIHTPVVQPVPVSLETGPPESYVATAVTYHPHWFAAGPRRWLVYSLYRDAGDTMQEILESAAKAQGRE